jgi:hypothetical protein
MSDSTFKQVYDLTPATALIAGDLMPLARSPYIAGDDRVIDEAGLKEQVQDWIAAFIQNGTGLTWTHNDGANTLTGNVTISQYTDEQAQDAVGGIFLDSAEINFTYDDAAPSITGVLINNSIAPARLAVSAGSRFVGRGPGGPGPGEELTGAQSTALLDVFTSALQGVVPASGGGTTNFLRADGVFAAPPGAGGGEANTASNVGTAGVGVFKQKTGVDLEFKKINAGSNRITITDDTGNNEVDVDAVEANFTLGNLGGSIDLGGGKASGTLAAARFPALTGDVTTTAGSLATTIAADAVTYAKIQNAASAGFIGATAAGDYSHRTPTEVTAALDVFTSTLKGLAPSSGGGTTNFLRADGTWAAPSGGGGSGDVVGPASATDNALVRFDSTTGKLVQNSAVTVSDNGEVLLAAGGTADAPLKFQSGTNLTTAEAGAIEYDGATFFATASAARRCVVPMLSWIVALSDRALTNDTSTQKIFNSPSNGALDLATGRYFFELLLCVTGMSATSGNAQFSVVGGGTATATVGRMQTVGVDNSSADGSLFTLNGQNVSGVATGTNSQTAGTGTAMAQIIFGTFAVSSAGTIIPSIKLLNASAATVKAESYFKCWRAGAHDAASGGAWS